MVYHAIDTAIKTFARVMLIDKIKFENGWPSIETGTPSTTAQKAPIVNNVKQVSVIKKGKSGF